MSFDSQKGIKMSAALREVAKINTHYPHATYAILIAMRSKFEKDQKFDDPISGDNAGNKGVLFIGPGGCGKSHTAKKIYENVESPPDSTTHWIASSATSTALGTLADFKDNPNGVFFMDEFSLDSAAQKHIFKQITAGRFFRRTAREETSFKFNGLVVANTNGIKFDGGAEHLDAVLDRFWIVDFQPKELTMQEQMDMIMGNYSQYDQDIDWSMINRHLYSNSQLSLNDNEKQLVAKLFAQKNMEVLVDKPQIRNGKAIKDIVTFVKRFSGISDVTENSDCMDAIDTMVNNCVIANPIGLVDLPREEKVVYRYIVQNDQAGHKSLKKSILEHLKEQGLNRYENSPGRYAARILDRLMDKGLVVRYSHGHYTTRKNMQMA
jgi:hypothetical protein